MLRASLLLSLVALLLTSACTGDLEVHPATLPDGTVGRPYEALITVLNNDTPLGGAVVEEGALPPGLSLEKVDSNTALIRGAPTQAGVFPFRLRLWCHGTNLPGQQANRDFTITIR